MLVDEEIPLVDIEEVINRLGSAYRQDMRPALTGWIRDLSELARHYSGMHSWNQFNVPGWVKAHMYAVLVDYGQNPEGFASSRAGDEGVTWHPGAKPKIDFSKAVIAELRAIRHAGGVRSTPTVLYCTKKSSRPCSCSSMRECLGRHPDDKAGCYRV